MITFDVIHRTLRPVLVNSMLNKSTQFFFLFTKGADRFGLSAAFISLQKKLQPNPV